MFDCKSWVLSSMLYTKQEIDYVEVDGDTVSAYEIKWNENVKLKKINQFIEAYKTDIVLINKKNFRDLLIEKK